MLDGPAVAAALREIGATHVVWIPDSELGGWEAALASDPELTLVRVAREAEAFGIAAGLVLGGKRPVIMIQCTGLFDAGDALRNVIHDLRLPILLLVGARGQLAAARGQSGDTCPQFTEAIVQAWSVPYRILTPGPGAAAELRSEFHAALDAGRSCVLIWPE